jgi:hypothetical protein
VCIQREREITRHTESKGDIQRVRRAHDTLADRERHTHRDTDRERHRQRETQTERDTDRETQTERDTQYHDQQLETTLTYRERRKGGRESERESE